MGWPAYTSESQVGVLSLSMEIILSTQRKNLPTTSSLIILLVLLEVKLESARNKSELENYP